MARGTAANTAIATERDARMRRRRKSNHAVSSSRFTIERGTGIQYSFSGSHTHANSGNASPGNERIVNQPRHLSQPKEHAEVSGSVVQNTSERP